MADIMAVIEKVIEEHKIILADLQALENVTNDAGALITMTRSQDVFKPGQLSPRDGLIKLNEMRNIVAIGLESHFNREETGLLEAFKEYGRQDFITALKTLLNEHMEIRSELSVLKGQIDELQTEKLSRILWESKGYDLLARISQLRKTMTAHAAEEQVLLHQVQDSLLLRPK